MKKRIRWIIPAVLLLMFVFNVSAQATTENKPVIKETKKEGSVSDNYKYAHFRRVSSNRKRINVQATDTALINHNYKQQAGPKGRKTKRSAIVITEQNAPVVERNYKHQVPLKRR